MWKAEFRLYFYAADSNHIAKKNVIESQLNKIEFIGDSLSEHRYAAGESFLSLLTFMGCSPNIELEPQDNRPYCYIEIHSSNQVKFISGKNTKPALCPNCKQAFSEPFLTLLKNEHFVRCDSCGTQTSPVKLNWRKSAFIASSWVTIGNIYELEAIPTDHLLDALFDCTGVKWKTAYIRHSIN